MEVISFLKQCRERSNLIIAIVLAFLLVGAALTFSQPLKYRSQSRLLIVQNISADPYTISKSNQYLGTLFSEIIYSGSFFDLMASDPQFKVDKNYFSGNYKKQMETWRKTVEAKSVGDSGILEISVYHQDPAQAKQISLAVNNTLMTQSFNYRGENQGAIKFNAIDQPIVSDYPVKPNVVANLAGALILGFIFSLVWVYLFPAQARNSLKREVRAEGERLIARYQGPDYQASINLVNNEKENYEEISWKEKYYRELQPLKAVSELDEGQENDDEDSDGFSAQGNIRNILK